MTTVDDILGARPSVRELARLAYERELHEAEIARQVQLIDLRADARAFVMDVLKQPEVVADQDIEFKTRPYSTGGSETVWWTLDGLGFRVRYESKKAHTLTSDAGTTQQHIYEEIPIFEVTRFDPEKTTVWEKVTDLASLGKLLEAYGAQA